MHYIRDVLLSIYRLFRSLLFSAKEVVIDMWNRVSYYFKTMYYIMLSGYFFYSILDSLYYLLASLYYLLASLYYLLNYLILYLLSCIKLFSLQLSLWVKSKVSCLWNMVSLCPRFCSLSPRFCSLLMRNLFIHKVKTLLLRGGDHPWDLTRWPRLLGLHHQLFLLSSINSENFNYLSPRSCSLSCHRFSSTNSTLPDSFSTFTCTGLPKNHYHFLISGTEAVNFVCFRDTLRNEL